VTEDSGQGQRTVDGGSGHVGSELWQGTIGTNGITDHPAFGQYGTKMGKATVHHDAGIFWSDYKDDGHRRSMLALVSSGYAPYFYGSILLQSIYK
jgi:hypothetical protein